MDYPIISLKKRKDFGNQIFGTEVTFILPNGMGLFLERSLNFLNKLRDLTPYLFHYSGNGHIIPSQSSGAIDLGPYIYLYLGELRDWVCSFDVAETTIYFPSGTLRCYLSPDGFMVHEGPIEQWTEGDPPQLVRIDHGGTLRIDEAFGLADDGQLRRVELTLQPKSEHLKWCDNGNLCEGWTFTDKSLSEAFPTKLPPSEEESQ